MAYLLVVDDDEEFAAAAATALRSAGHEVLIEGDTSSAMQSMNRRRPDLVVLDVMFPEDSSAGFGLARAMRHEPGDLKDVPILMLTAINTRFPLGFGPHDIDSEWLPVTEFVEKPVDLEYLIERANHLLQGAARQQEGPE